MIAGGRVGSGAASMTSRATRYDLKRPVRVFETVAAIIDSISHSWSFGSAWGVTQVP